MISVSAKVSKIEKYNVTKQDIWTNSSKVITKADWNEEMFHNPIVHRKIFDFVSKKMYCYYPDVYAHELMETLAKFHNVKQVSLSVYPGSDEALDTICKIYLNEGDIVSYRNPEYSNFYVFANSYGATLKPFYDDNPFVLSVDELKKHLNISNPKIHYLSNPNNPTGLLYKISDLVDIFQSYPNTLFILDEAYIHFAYQNQEEQDYFIKNISNFNNLIIVRTFSKIFSLAGLRVGYIVANEKTIVELDLVRKGKNVSMIAQIAASESIRQYSWFMDKVKSLEIIKNDFVNKLHSLNIFTEIHQSYANFICVTIDSKVDNLINYLENNGIYFRDRSNVPQLSNTLRITIIPEIETTIDVIRAYFREK